MAEQKQRQTFEVDTIFLFWETAKLFATVFAPFYIPTCREWGFQFLKVVSITCLWSVLLIIAILVGVNGGLIVLFYWGHIDTYQF